MTTSRVNNTRYSSIKLARQRSDAVPQAFVLLTAPCQRILLMIQHNNSFWRDAAQDDTMRGIATAYTSFIGQPGSRSSDGGKPASFAR